MPDLASELRAKLLLGRPDEDADADVAITCVVCAELQDPRYENDTFTYITMSETVGYVSTRARNCVSAALSMLRARGDIDWIKGTNPREYVRVRIPEQSLRLQPAMHTKTRRSDVVEASEPGPTTDDPQVEPSPTEVSSLPIDAEDAAELEEAFETIRSLCRSRLIDLSTVSSEALVNELLKRLPK